MTNGFTFGEIPGLAALTSSPRSVGAGWSQSEPGSLVSLVSHVFSAYGGSPTCGDHDGTLYRCTSAPTTGSPLSASVMMPLGSYRTISPSGVTTVVSPSQTTWTLSGPFWICPAGIVAV